MSSKEKYMITTKLKQASKLMASSALTIALLIGVVSFAAPAFAVDTTAACEGVQATGGTCTGGEGEIKGIINTVVDILSIIVGAVSVIMIIIGGLRYITSAGDSSNVQAAKNTILYAIVGLVIVIFAQAIVAFVVNRVAN